MGPLVSFVVPCCNNGRFLGHCLTSIFGQTLAIEFEVVVVDDASTDTTQEVIEKNADSRMHTFRHTQKQGYVRTTQEAITAAKGFFISKIDPDDRYRPHFLAMTLQALRDNPECAIAYGDSSVIDDKGIVKEPRADNDHQGRDFKGNEFLQLLQRNFFNVPIVIAKAEAWRKALATSGKSALNDWNFLLQMSRGYDSCYLNQVLTDRRFPLMKESKNGSDEKSVFFLLDQIFQQTENNPLLEKKKRRARRKVYASQYLRFAQRYQRLGMRSEVKRCYRNLLRYSPIHLLDLSVLESLWSKS
ncbi:MAG: hypothetical protein C5B54_09315 [Acidobacteria bacterium]|nr:MAG: hypothetical protein C5B54_09315 [Acidobacteriota bacterium]